MSKTVLIAEDEPPIRRALQTFLEARGLRVIPACDGAEAIACLDREKPDLVVLDLLMPRIDGLGVLLHLRERYPDLPVIVSTNLSKGFDRAKWAEMGVTDVVIKSETSLHELARTIQERLDSAAAAGLQESRAITPAVLQALIEKYGGEDNIPLNLRDSSEYERTRAAG